MKSCDKRCLANVNGQCAVEHCEGAIIRFCPQKETDMDRAAKRYQMARLMFKDEFVEGNSHD